MMSPLGEGGWGMGKLPLIRTDVKAGLPLFAGKPDKIYRRYLDNSFKFDNNKI
jgi:hypothetical protein